MRKYFTVPLASLTVLAVFAVVNLLNDWHPIRAVLYLVIWVAAVVFIARRTGRRANAS